MPRLLLASLLGLSFGLSGCILDRSGTRRPTDGGVDAAPDAALLPRCGDGLVDPGEDCDGFDLGGATCESEGFDPGALRCDDACHFETSRCGDPCGNGVLDPGEVCDGAVVAGATCATLGLEDGVITCNADCMLDPSQCLGCGNGRVEAGEACDGADFGGLTCTGGLACDACAIDARACTVPSAGDGSDGDLGISADAVFDATTRAPGFAAASIAGDRVELTADPIGLAAGDDVLVLDARGAPGACDEVGHYEVARVASITGRELALAAPLAGTYGAGHAILVQRIPRFGRVELTGPSTLAPRAWDGATGGVIAFRARELIVGGEAVLGAPGRGFRGGLGWTSDGRRSGRRGASRCGDPQDESTMPNDGGGGGGRFVDPGDGCGQGGGGGGYGGVGGSEGYASECVRVGARDPAGNGGGVYGGSDLGAAIFLGSGGGAGGSDDHSDLSGSGGAGGGVVMIWAATATIEGTLSATGADGLVSGDTDDAGNGGGGSGGTIVLRAATLMGGGKIDARGGAGPAGRTGWNSAGGAGGVGRLRIDYFTANGAAFGTPEAMSYTASMSDPTPGQRELFLE
ncbi:MAG: hypothetical protein H6719_14870 [Sandaracinaceae bacterium]|nr:hypothetical protein [Sandaracinaceae bacterium]